jgi:NADH:ubiquinone oxidoreductase subunit F (NADH-binding)
MPQCKKCGKKGLFLKIEGDTGLCLACNEGFAQEGKILTQRIIEAKNEATATKDAEKLVSLCKSIESHGKELVALHQAYNLQPSQELLDLIGTYKKMREEAEK